MNGEDRQVHCFRIVWKIHVWRAGPGQEPAKSGFVRGLNEHVLFGPLQIGCSRDPEITFALGLRLLHELSGIRGARLSGELARCAKHVDSIVPAHCFHLPHHATQMILHGELRQIQIGRYFLIGQPFGH